MRSTKFPIIYLNYGSYTDAMGIDGNSTQQQTGLVEQNDSAHNSKLEEKKVDMALVLAHFLKSRVPLLSQ